MAATTPRRRSSRLHSRNGTPSRNDLSGVSASKLISVLEREESPPNKLQNIDEVISSPVAPPNTSVGQRYGMPGSFDTPPAAQRVYPGLEEMHPSKAHQSTVKEPTLINALLTAPAAKASTKFTEATPSKSRGSLPAHMSSPGFDFSFTRPESDLSEEAQKIMDSVREEAARIKAQMQAEREKKSDNDGPSKLPSTIEGRKIAHPRSGRYSDAHKQQFQKMDSIAHHVSTWKTRIQSSVTAPTTSSSLKRSNSRADLDKPESSATPSGLPRSKSFKTLPPTNEPSAFSGKRVKRSHDDDASKTRPISRDSNEEKELPSAKAHPPGLPSAVSTPTKASLARSASVKANKTSMIPSLSRSASTKTLGTPKTEPSNRFASRLAKFSPVKSILHRSQPKFSEDPLKVAAGTHLPLPTKPLSLNKDLPELPTTPSKHLQRTPSAKKHVNFSPSTKPVSEIIPVASPSPSKIPRSDSMKALPSPNVTQRNTHKIPTAAPAALPNQPGDFTFSPSNNKTISFGPPTSGLSKTIRAVRPSGFPTPLAESAFENHKHEGGIPHGIKNKKRKHGHSSEDEDNEDQENIDPRERGESPSKKIKVSGGMEKQKEGGSAVKVKKVGKLGGTPKRKGKGIMSFSRLQALSKPKER
ncbi:MAG: hypothetical protein LQ346_002408 [Caloplaca aetnensis]|nr:MAG: hypothetical protein LQ346_002408 [Caloplaca aetnensis]